MTYDGMNPLDRTVESNYIIYQDSPVKGLRIVNAQWFPKRAIYPWLVMGYFYSPDHLQDYGWHILEEGTIPENIE